MRRSGGDVRNYMGRINLFLPKRSITTEKDGLHYPSLSKILSKAFLDIITGNITVRDIFGEIGLNR